MINQYISRKSTDEVYGSMCLFAPIWTDSALYGERALTSPFALLRYPQHKY